MNFRGSCKTAHHDRCEESWNRVPACSALLLCCPTINGERVSGNEGRIVRAKPQDSPCDLVWLCWSSHGYFGNDFGLLFLSHRLQRRGVNDGRTDRISSEILFGVFECNRPSKTDNAVFAGAVRRPGLPAIPAIEDRLTIAPPPESNIAGISCFIPSHTPFWVTSTTRSHSASERSVIGAGASLPAFSIRLTVSLTASSSMSSTKTAAPSSANRSI